MTGPQPTTPLWRIEVLVPRAASAVFESVLEPMAVALSTEDDGPGRCLIALTAGPPDPARLDDLIAWASATTAIDPPTLRVAPMPSVDWLSQNQRDLSALTIGRFRIRGSHVPPLRRPGIIELEIDAGQAFGTGHHETTLGCLRLIEMLARRASPLRPLDLGCGTGILAMAMARLWRRSITAVDIDPLAVRITADNAQRNRLAGHVKTMTADGVDRRGLNRRDHFDLIVANILAGPLERMAPSLAAICRPGGHAVLSGLLAHQKNAVLYAYRQQGMVLVRQLDLAGWVTLLIAKPGASRDK